jgi:hypothetical protein
MAKIDQALEPLRKLLERLSADREAILPGERLPLSRRFFIDREEGTLFLDDTEAAELAEIGESIARAIEGRVGRAGVERAVQSAIFHTLDINDQRSDVPSKKRLNEAMTSLRKQLTQPPRIWTVTHRVHGLDSEGLPFTVGRVQFCIFDEALRERFYDRIDDVLETAPNVGTRTSREKYRDELEHDLADQVVALVNVEAIEGSGARSRSVEELRFTLDGINFFADQLMNPGLRPFLYLGTEFSPQTEVSPSATFEGDAHFEFQAQRIGQLKPMSVMSLQSQRAAQLGFPRLGELLMRRETDSLAARLLNSLRWAGRATTARRREESLLFYTIALESLLLGNRDAMEIGFRLRTRAAHLLAESLPERRALQSDIDSLYRARSRTAHGGVTDILDADLIRVRRFAKRAIHRLLVDPTFYAMDDEAQLETWFENRLLETAPISAGIAPGVE